MFSLSKRATDRGFLLLMVAVPIFCVYTVGRPAMAPTEEEIENRRKLMNENARLAAAQSKRRSE
jgi:hypothetical protein